MQLDRESELGTLEAQLASKEREWKELQALRVHQLESSLKKAQEECSSLRELYQQLREDFQFNLAILDERDRELKRYDAINAKALTVECSRQEELSHLCMQVAKLKEQRATETEERQKELSKSHHDAAQHRLQLDDVKRSMAGEIEKQTKEYKRSTWDLEHRIQELEEKLTLQQQMELLSKKTEIYYQAYLQVTEALKASKECCLQIQAQLHYRDHEVKDLIAVKDNRIKELEDQLKWMETKFKKEEDHIQRYEDLVQALKECDVQMKAQHQCFKRELQKAEKHIVQLQRSLELLTAHECFIQEVRQESMHQKDETIQRLRTGWDNYLRHVSTEMVVKDTKMITLQEREVKLKTELGRSREEVDRYKQQLSEGLKRERTSQQMQVQEELEWQRHCEDIKAKHYLTNGQLIQDLTQARDQAEAELKEKNQQLQDLTVLLHSVQTERDQAIQDSTSKVDCLPSEEIRHLQEQNSMLRAAVTLMRKDMESLSYLTQPQASQHPETHDTPTTKMTSGPPNNSTNRSLKVTPADVVFLEKHVKPSASTEQEVRVTDKESALTNIMEQNALVQQLQEENLYVQGAKSNHTLMHNRLKQAASCIAHLCREKQQLIDMANRLRAQITAAGLKAELVAPLKDSLTKKQGDQQDQLSSLLGKLQYQLTTQELQYVLRQRVCTVSEPLLPGTSNQDPSTNGGDNSWSQGHRTTDRTESSNNKDNVPLHCLSQNSLNIQPQLGLPKSQLSSEESLQSLKELWDILDLQLSSSIFSEGDDELSWREIVESDSLGFSVPIHRQTSADGKQRMNPSKPTSNLTKTSKPEISGRIGKIRNYNVKD